MKNASYGFSDEGSFRDQARIGKPTSYAKEQGGDTNKEMGSWWWLRSPGGNKVRASGVNEDGYVGSSGYGVYYSDKGVRPALHLNLNSTLVTKGEKEEVSLKSAEWDTVELGIYDGRPITWRVLSVSGQDVFLLSDGILTNKNYHDNNTYESVTWESSTLRSWLNTEFYEEAFTDEEQEGIIETDYANEDNPWYGIYGGADTKDHVSLLSLSDIVNKEYGFPTEYKCEHPARIACGEEGYSEDGDGSLWWLRSPGLETYCASNVLDGGSASYNFAVYQSNHGGVRPALHFNLSSYPLTKKGTVTAEAGVGVTFTPTTPDNPDVPSNPDTPEEPTDQTEPTTEEPTDQTEPTTEEPTDQTETTTEKPTDQTEATTEEPTDQTEATTEKPTDQTEASTEKPTNKSEATTEKPTVTTETLTKKKDKPTTLNIKNKKTYKKSKKVTVKDSDGIKQIKLNSKTIKVKGKKKFSFKLSKYKKYLKKKGKWNKLVVTDKNGKKKTIKFKTR